jgi:hypothetical protein
VYEIIIKNSEHTTKRHANFNAFVESTRFAFIAVRRIYFTVAVHKKTLVKLLLDYASLEKAL